MGPSPFPSLSGLWQGVSRVGMDGVSVEGALSAAGSAGGSSISIASTDRSRVVRLVRPLRQPDAELRGLALVTVVDHVRALLSEALERTSVGDPASSSSSTNEASGKAAGEVAVVGYGGDDGASGSEALVKEAVLTVRRLATEAPFRDVRESFASLLEWLGETKRGAALLAGLPPLGGSPSRFLKAAELPRVDGDAVDGVGAVAGGAGGSDSKGAASDGETKGSADAEHGEEGSGVDSNSLEAVQLRVVQEASAAFQRSFVQRGRVTHLQHVLGMHPSYLERHLVTARCLTYSEHGPIPVVWRHYIAMMAAARHDCVYLINEQAEAFLAAGGEPSWLGGLSAVPAKLANLAQLNALIAHQPWLIEREHIAALIKPGPDAWSVTELVHAIILMASFHAQCTLVGATGVEPEVDVPDHVAESEAERMAAAARLMVRADEAAVEEITGRFARVVCEEDDLKNRLLIPVDKLMDEHGRIGLGADGEEDDEDVFESAGVGAQFEDGSTDAAVPLRSSKFCGHPLAYRDFDTHAFAPFRTQDYSWEDQGFSLVSRYFPEAAPLLDDQFSHTYSLTYGTFSDSAGVDTEPFRRAVWYYVHRLFGICNDEYDYRQVNVYVPRPVKAFVKRAACVPESTTREDFSSFSAKLTVSEKVHICLLTAEARKQSSLLYALFAVMDNMMS